MEWIHGLIITALLTGTLCQESAPRKDSWLIRATSLTGDLRYDAPRIGRYDRAVLWARLGAAWFKADPDGARGWSLKSVELLELPEDDKDSLTGRLTAARAVVGIVAMHDKKLHDRLMSIIDANKKDQNDSQRMENATALADVGLALIATDPQSAGRFGEASLRLGFSFRLGNLLWRLRARDPATGDRLFRQVVEATVSTRDFNLFSLAVGAAFQGPFSDNHRELVLSALAGAILRPSHSEEATSRHLASAVFVAPLLPYYDILLPPAVRSPDKRTALRLELLRAALEQHQAASKKVTLSKTR